MNSMKIGCHLSVAQGYLHMGKEAISIDANTFQFFTRNPRGWKTKELNIQDMEDLISLMKSNGFSPILAHAPYTLNPCAADERVHEFALMVMKEDLAIMEHMPENYYNFHPGSHVGQGIEAGIQLIVEALDHMLYTEQKTTVLLETMSGKGSEVGSTFEELQEIIQRVRLNDKLGVCMDSCHIYSAGYNIVEDLDGILEKFDKVIGLNRLKAIHLNDSMTPFGSKKDRHAKIGQGTIGLDAIIRFINHPLLKNLPFYLETPNDVPGYAEEIKILRQAYNE
ncbi:MAG TPA: deoxyribonuclease IV [Flexilinea sp.]|nr:deoxyribonuclease IV [Flexilinea sp.]HOW06310.1 deoxyribonuclease IV [Flexilinea sp.]HPS46956.1 deoxyribonuclease IV [Flexilinea sp.]